MKIRSFILLLLLLLFGCSFQDNDYQGYQKSNKNLKSIILNKIGSFTINTEDSILIGNLLSPFVINKNATRIAFYDLLRKHFLITDNNGNVLYIVGKPGRGPSEFVSVQGWDFDENNNLIVCDAGQRMIKIFDSDGKLKKAFSIFENEALSSSGRGLFVKDSLIYIGILEMKHWDIDRENIGESNLIAVFDYNGKLIDTIGQYDPYTEKANYYGSSPQIYINFNFHKLYATHGNSYRIQIYDLNNNKRLDYFGFKSTHFKESPEVIEYYYSTVKIFDMSLNQSFSNGIFLTSNYIIFFFENLSERWNQTRNSKYKEYFINIYNRESHDFVSEIFLPYELATVHKSKLYLIEDYNPNSYTIGIYEM